MNQQSMTRRAASFPILAVLLSFALPIRAADPAPEKLNASAIQIALVETRDVEIPAEFRYAMYEHIIEHVRKTGTFQKVFRGGDRAADAVPDLVTLHTAVEKFTEGSQTKREVTTVTGATKVDVSATLTARDGRALVDRKVSGKVRFFGENLGATNDLAKRIAKLLKGNF
jgi:hypothetical protein